LTKKRIYIDGAWDLFHIGHLQLFKKIKKKFNYLIVGIHSDELMEKIKRKPVIPYEDRAEIIKSIKYVDEIAERSPFPTIDFIKKHKIDLIAKTNSTLVACDPKDEEAIKKLNIFYNLESSKYHTSDIINKITKNSLYAKTS
tara:strand:+ start:768 stop:1193 length:426 start_codon:yes stop_codon:yes gene_type:complete